MSGTPRPSATVVVVATTVTMIAFASNSLLCRMALERGDIDPLGFTAIRLSAGAAALFAIARIGGRRRTAANRGSWASALALFAYAVGFSLAYVRLGAGTGALILFACVQVTMIARGLAVGERPHPLQWIGLLTAVAGLAYLVSPGLTAPSPTGSALMALAGAAWGVYSLRGLGAVDPIVATADNFVRAVPLGLVAALVGVGGLHATSRGALLAVVSGALASGVGYIIWYVALGGLSATRAATVQLTVPVLAAVGGVVLLGERPTLRLGLASLLILGGVAFSLAGRVRIAAPRGARLPSGADPG